MKLRQEVKEMLLQPKVFGLLLHKINKPVSTLERWINTDYKDLRLPENARIIAEVTGIPESQLFEEESIREVYDNI